MEGKSVGLMAERYRMVAVPVGRGLAEEGAEERYDHDFVFRCQVPLPSSVATIWDGVWERAPKKEQKNGAKKGSSAVRCSHWGSNQHQCDQQALRTIDFGWHAKPKATIVTKCPFVVFPAAYLKGRSGLALR